MKVSSRHCVTLVMVLGILMTTPIVKSDSVIVLEHKENFIINRNTKEDYPLVVLNGSVFGYNLSAGDILQVSWSAEEDPLLVSPIVFLLTREQWLHYTHTIGGPHPLYGYLVKEIEWVGTFQYSIASNGTYFVVIHNINWPALGGGIIGPTLNVSTYDAVKTIVEKPTPPIPVGGYASPIDISISKSELLALWMWLSTIVLLIATTAVFVKHKKKKQ